MKLSTEDKLLAPVDKSIPLLLQPGLKDRKVFARHSIKKAVKVMEMNIENASLNGRTAFELKKVLKDLMKELKGNERT